MWEKGEFSIACTEAYKEHISDVKPVFLCRQKSECADGGWVDDINY